MLGNATFMLMGMMEEIRKREQFQVHTLKGEELEHISGSKTYTLSSPPHLRRFQHLIHISSSSLAP